jgi:molybdate transport system substrate-binding protein
MIVSTIRERRPEWALSTWSARARSGSFSVNCPATTPRRVVVFSALPGNTARFGRLMNLSPRLIVMLSALTLLAASASTHTAMAGERLLIYAGAASKPPTEDAVKLFEEKTGAKVEVVFGGSGYVLSQMRLAKQGDLYFPGSSDYMEKAKRGGDVFPDTEKIVAYLVPAINVQKGNPHNIHSVSDLTRPGIKVAIADPETVCVGAYAVEIIEGRLSPEEQAAFKKNLLNYTGSCERTATAISLKQVDAVIGWRVFQYWDPERIETVPLPAREVPRVGYIPIAVSKFTQDRALAQRFIDFLLSAEGRGIVAKYHYFATPDAAFAWLGARKPVGGEYVVPADWLKK